MKRVLLKTFCAVGFYLLIPSVVLLAQNGLHQDKLSEHISEENLRKYLEIIASDEFEGRETGKPGQYKAAAFIADKFREFGLKPGLDTSYFQHFELEERGIKEAGILFGNTRWELLKDFYFFPGMARSGENKFNNLTFLGYGIDDPAYSDYNTINVTPENIIIWQGEPKDTRGNYRITKSNLKSAWSKDFMQKVDVAKRKGIKNLFIITEDFTQDVKRYAYYIRSSRLTFANEERSEPEMSVFFISSSTAKQFLGTNWNERKTRAEIEKGKPLKPVSAEGLLTVSVDVARTPVYTSNVIGVLEGTDKADEYLVITAHYDHLGIRGGEIFNGADDDGSGTVAVLEMARAMSERAQRGIRPRRTVVFMPVSGEEKGLLGSEYYVNNPVFPLNQTVANLNVDMVGRTDAEHKDWESPYVYVIGSNRMSTRLHELSEQVNASCCGLILDYTYNDPNDPNKFYYRSDHYNFAKNGIPVIFYFSGVHEDYHRPSDTVEKIEFGNLKKRTNLIFHTAWALANDEERPEVDVFETEEDE